MKITSVYMETTSQCNLNCHTCYNRSGLNHERKEVSVEQIEKIIQNFLPYGTKRFLISGGEPTLHTQFDDILALFDSYPELSFGIVTNGTTHCSSLINFLNTHNNVTLQISLDGSCEEQNAKTRGVGHFDDTIDFTRSICNPNLKRLLKMVISQSNFNDIENFYRLAISLGCTPEFAFIYKSGNGSDTWDNKALSAQQKLKALKLIAQLNTEFNTSAFLPFCTNKCSYVDGLKQVSLCIKVDGSIQPCQVLYSSKYTVGNVFAFDADAFERNLRHLAALANQRYHTDYHCNNCLLRDCCGKGCMASAVNLYDDPLADDGDCEFRKIQFLGYDLKEMAMHRYDK